jgi:hypothetical protein
MNTDEIPSNGEYRGVRLHVFQDESRLDVVRRDIDDCFALDDAAALFTFAGDICRAPEARLLAAARVEALFAVAAERRISRPDVDLDKLGALVAGLSSLLWISSEFYGTVLTPGPAPGERRPLRRPTPLTCDEIERARQ